jgi:hypothetical protein
MMIRLKPATEFREWHPWFAWRPVETEDGFLVWWQTVQRRDKCDAGAAWACETIWEYRTYSAKSVPK